MSGNKDLQGVRVLLTGASGLLGHNVLRTLLERGCKVRAVVRKSGAIRSEAIPEGTEVLLETVLGDILDFNNLEQWCQGCDAVINCAGTTDMSLLRLEDYLPVNCSLPEAICAVMERNTDLRTLVSVSSANTVGNGSPQSPADESAPFAPPYSASLPRRLCVLVGALGDLLRKLGVRTMLSRANVELMCEREHYDNSKAVRELGLPQTPLEDAVIAFWNSWLSRK